MNEKETKNYCVQLVKSMLSAGNARIWKYKMQFQYCRIELKIIQYKNWKTHNTFRVATITSSVPMELQSPAIVTLTLNDVLNSIKQFTQTLLTMRVTIKMKGAASQWSGDDWVRIDRDEWMKKETKICCVKSVESIPSAGNDRIRKYKMQFHYCRIQ